MMNIEFVKEQFEIAKKASHLSETIVIDIKTMEWIIEQVKEQQNINIVIKEYNQMYLKEIKQLKERNSRYAETIDKLKMDKYTLEIDFSFAHKDIERLKAELKENA
jgi:hypothetical protein